MLRLQGYKSYFTQIVLRIIYYYFPTKYFHKHIATAIVDAGPHIQNIHTRHSKQNMKTQTLTGAIIAAMIAATIPGSVRGQVRRGMCGMSVILAIDLRSSPS